MAINGFCMLLGVFCHAQQFLPEIQAYIENSGSALGLTSEDARQWSVSDQYTDAKTGITHTYIQQEISGIPIFNAISAVAIKEGKVAHFAPRFFAKASQKSNTTHAEITPEKAIQLAANHLGLPLLSTPVFVKNVDKKQQLEYSASEIASKNIVLEAVFVPTEHTLQLAWNVNIKVKDSPDWWNVRVDATTGSILEKNNWTVSCDFGAAGALGEHVNHATFPAGTGVENSADGSYNVFPFPLEAPSFGGRSLLVNPASPVSSPYGWHDTDGQAGAEYTITRGNNVHAYEDVNDTNQPGYSPDGGAALNFDFPLDFSLDPLANVDPIITNLFYVNNALHDILYRHGFDETAGNFQEKNYTNDGLGGDYVLAEGQDGGGTNNANFSTPDDGQNGTMQMYLWPSGASALFTINSPAGIAGNYDVILSSFGPGLSAPITANVVLVNDGVAPETDACEAILNGAQLAGNIALIDRGTCNFISKVQAAQSAGAIAAIVVNNTPAGIMSMGGTGTVNIPSAMISQADGQLMKDQLGAGAVVNATIAPNGSSNPTKDGSLDNGIVAHEYGHGLSNRLTGGPSNSNCLFNGEQGGEGWSDWLALILTIEPGDAGTNSRGIGTYALNEPVNGLGIRRYPYSTDMSINPQTYADLAVSSEVHDIGEIWSQVLWDMTWKLIDLEGFNSDWENGTGGNNTALRLVIEGMKLQPCGPGFLDARNAILAADELLYGNAHRCLIWEAFARRGMGKSAIQGSAGNAGDETAAFDIPTFCQTAIIAPTALFSVDTASACYGFFKFTDQSTDIPQEWHWDFGDGTTSTEFNPTHTYTAAGSYNVVLTVTNTIGSDQYAFTVHFFPPVAPTISGNTSVCLGNSTVLTAAVLPGNTAEWSAGGSLVYTGTSFATPPISAPTTFAVRQVKDTPVEHVGPVDNSFGGGGNHATGFEGRLLFEAYVPFHLKSAYVYAQGAGNRTFTLYDASDNVIETVTVAVPAGASRIQLDLDVPNAGLYSVGNVSQNLYRNNSGASYPYTVNNLVRIYTSNATTNPLAYYYYLYDWEVQESACGSLPVDVPIAVIPGPVAGFSAVKNNLIVNFTDNSTGSPTTWNWNFGDGSPASSLQNPTHTYSASGTYTVTLEVSDGSCMSSWQFEITVTAPVGTHTAQSDEYVQIFPNPARDLINIAFDEPVSGPVVVEISDAAGRLIIAERYDQAATSIKIIAADWAAGVYTVRVKSKLGTSVVSLSIVR